MQFFNLRPRRVFDHPERKTSYSEHLSTQSLFPTGDGIHGGSEEMTRPFSEGSEQGGEMESSHGSQMEGEIFTPIFTRIY